MSALVGMFTGMAVAYAWLYIDPATALIITMLGVAVLVGWFDAKHGR